MGSFSAGPPPTLAQAAQDTQQIWLKLAPLIIGVWLIGFLKCGLYRRPISIRLDPRHSEGLPPPSAQPGASDIPPLALIAAALLVWMSQPLGAGAVAAALSITSTPTPAPGVDPLRSHVLVSGAGYIGALIAIAAICLLLHGIFTAIGGKLFHKSAPVTTLDRAKALLPALWWSLAVIPIVYAAGAASLAIAQWIAQLRNVPPPGEMAHETLKQLAEAPHSAAWWASVLLAVIGAPIIEETIYRGLLQTGLLHLTRKLWPSVLITSTLFTLAHIGAVAPHALPTLFVLSIGFGLAMERTGRLITSIIMHSAFNALNIAMAMWV